MIQVEKRFVLLARMAEDNLKMGRALDLLSIPWRSMPLQEARLTRPSREELSALHGLLPVSAVAFTSRWAVLGLAALEETMSRILSRPDGAGPLLMAAVGRSTASVMESLKHRPDLLANPATAAALGSLLIRTLQPGCRVLLPQGPRPRLELLHALEGGGIEALRLKVYHVIDTPPNPASLPFDPGDALVVVVGSPSQADILLETCPFLASRRFVSMGPTTKARLEELGVLYVHAPEEPGSEGQARCAARTFLDLARV